jgi:hypothetical protein
VSLFRQGEQRYVIKFFVEEGVKGVEIMDRLNQHYDGDALQRTPVYCWIKQVKSGRKNLSKVPPAGRALDNGLNDYIGKALKEDPHPSTREIAKTLKICPTTVRNHLTKSLGMKCYHMRGVPHGNTIVITFFNDIGEYFVNILPRTRFMDTMYLAEKTVGGPEDVCSREGRNLNERSTTLHFDNAPMPNTRRITGQLEQSESKRIGHPAHGPDLSPCDFFLLGYMKEGAMQRRKSLHPCFLNPWPRFHLT